MLGRLTAHENVAPLAMLDHAHASSHVMIISYAYICTCI